MAGNPPIAASPHTALSECSQAEDYSEELCSVAHSGVTSLSHENWSAESGFVSLNLPGVSEEGCLDQDSHNFSDYDSDWDEDEWPSNHPLPIPIYGCERPELVFENVARYEDFHLNVREILQEAIQSVPYDSVSTFFQFCQEYFAERAEYESLEEFFRDYDLPQLSGRNTCVGLAIDLLSRLSVLEKQYPGAKDALYLVSVEEIIEDVESYCSSSSPPIASCEKEHVMLCVRVRIQGRGGIILMDPGYNVAEPITVMEDNFYPHSEPYTSRNGKVSTVYTYNFYTENPLFVEWKVRKGQSEHTNLVYINKPFLSGMDNAERRNLAYPVKTLTNRHKNGDVKSGFYVVIKKSEECEATFFVQKPCGQMEKVKIPISYFRRKAIVWYDQPESNPAPSFLLQQPLVSARSCLEGESTFSKPCSHNLKYPKGKMNQEIYLDSHTEFHKHNQMSKINTDWDNIIEEVGLDAGRVNEVKRLLNHIGRFLTDESLVPDLTAINKRIGEFSDDN